MTEKRAHVFISGRVQGVSFRYYTVQEAKKREIAGMVRNLPDGRVEAIYQGAPADVEAMVNWSRTGPPSARVRDVDVRWEDPQPGANGFHIRY